MSDQRIQASSSETDARVELVAYDESWPSRFEAERSLLEAVLGRWLAGPIEHIGSTAVPGLSAKPVIDIMAPVKTLEASRPAIGAAPSAGYVYYPYKAEVMHWFCKPSPSFRTHHLHLLPFGSALWYQRLAFRDALRKSATLAAEYADLKVRLAAEFRLDREAYTDAKAPFVHRVLSESRPTAKMQPDPPLDANNRSSRKTAAFAFETLDTAPVSETAIIDAGLDAWNCAAAPLNAIQPVTCVARAPSGEVLGGAVGRTWGECAELQQLWVASEHRRNGIGSELVRLFEARAKARGCRTLYLTTFSFQAPALYQSLGYRSAAEVRGFPSGIVKYLMVRTVAPDEA